MVFRAALRYTASRGQDEPIFVLMEGQAVHDAGGPGEIAKLILSPFEERDLIPAGDGNDCSIRADGDAAYGTFEARLLPVRRKLEQLK